MATYFLIEAIRMYLPAKKNMIAFFLFDQLLHIEVLAGIVIWWQQIHVLLDFMQNPVLLIYTTGIVFVTLPLSVIIRIMVSRWETAAGAGNDDTLQNAGSYIGMLERLCILLFALIGRREGVGFLIAAKSVFRFADTKGHPGRKRTENFLIGTLLSIGLAMLTGMAMRFLLGTY